MLDDSLLEAAERVRAQLDATDAMREQALVFSRALIRTSATAIRLVHQRRFQEAEELIARNSQALADFSPRVRSCPELAGAPFVIDGEREHLEAWAALCLATGRAVPSPEEAGCQPAAYLSGLAEAVSEVRRYVVDLIRTDRVLEGEAILARMDAIYDVLVTFDYPDALLYGLRRRLDAVRGVIEKTRHDITTAIRQGRLERAMAHLESRIGETDAGGTT